MYGSLVCLAQKSLKRLIAFSSVGHMGFVLLGISTLTAVGINGALIGNVAHGLITGLLFFLVGSLKDRYHTDVIDEIGGGAQAKVPYLGGLLGFTAIASLGLPGLAGFWGEMMALLGAYHPAAGLNRGLFLGLMTAGGIGAVLTAAYLLWMLARVNQGVVPPRWRSVRMPTSAWSSSRSGRRWCVLTVAIGVWPKLVLGMSNGAVSALIGGAAMKSQSVDLVALLPALIVAGTAFLVLVADLFWSPSRRWLVRTDLLRRCGGRSRVGVRLVRAHAACDVLPVARARAPTSRTGSRSPSRSSCWPRRRSSCCSAGTSSTDSRLPAGEYHFLLLASVVGAVTMASSRDLLSLLVSLEVVSLPAFVLVGLRRDDARSAEAALKFFLISVVATAVTLMGMSLVYGVTGSLQLDQVAARSRRTRSPASR